MTIVEKICLRNEVKRGTTRPEHFAAIKAVRIQKKIDKALVYIGNGFIILCGLALLWLAGSYIATLCGSDMGGMNLFTLLIDFCKANGLGGM